MNAKQMLTPALLAAAVTVAMGAGAAEAKDLTLCWAAWDPANALVELSKEYEAQSGNKMHFEFVPWTSFADRMLNELNSGGKLCDLMIGDSQWIGGAAENGQYIKLNDFFDANKIKMDDFIPATVVGYSEWPKNTPNYWALPAFGDVVGWTYRKDWFTRPELKTEFKAKYGHELAAPATFDELKQVAEFFQNRDIDGKKVYGASIYTERGSEGITMGVMDVLYSYGFKYENPAKPYDMEGFVNSANAVKGLEFYKSLYDCCVPPGSSNGYMTEGVDAFKSGQVAMQMNFAFTWPGLSTPMPTLAVTAPAISPTRQGRLATSSRSSAGRASRSSRPRTSRTRRCPTSSGSHNPASRPSGGNWVATRRSVPWWKTPALPPASLMRRPSSTAWRS